MTSHTSTSPPIQTNILLSAVGIAPTVRVAGYAYLVDIGRGVQPRVHTVHKDRSCTCGDTDCPAIGVVATWLKLGRIERAPEPPRGYTPFLPLSCPICGAAVVAEHRLSSRRRGIGWHCANGSSGHYWQHQWQSLKGWFFRTENLPGPFPEDFKPTDDWRFGDMPHANAPNVVSVERGD